MILLRRNGSNQWSFTDSAKMVLWPRLLLLMLDGK